MKQMKFGPVVWFVGLVIMTGIGLAVNKLVNWLSTILPTSKSIFEIFGWLIVLLTLISMYKVTRKYFWR